MTVKSLPQAITSELLRLSPYLGLLLFSGALIAVRIERTHSFIFFFLIWNLTLAAVPLCASSALRAADRFRLPRVLLLPLVGLWLLFLPNAPYILTDLIHLQERPPVPMWYDLGLLLTCAGTGLALGYRSVLDVEAVLARWFGRWLGFAACAIALFSSGFGIYLGRFLRLNSWEAVTEPTLVFGIVFERVAHPLMHAQTWGVTILFGLPLVLGYAAIRSAQSGGVPEHRPTKSSPAGAARQ